MIVLDASVLIGYLDGSDANHPAAFELLSREIDDDLAVNVAAARSLGIHALEFHTAEVSGGALAEGFELPALQREREWLREHLRLDAAGRCR